MAAGLYTDEDALRIIKKTPFDDFVFLRRNDDRNKNFPILMKKMNYTEKDIVFKVLKQLTEEDIRKANQPARNHYRIHGECTKVWVFVKSITIVNTDGATVYNIYIKLIIDTKTNKIEILSFHDQKNR